MAEMPENQLLQRLDQRLQELGISDRELSMRVTGKPDLVRDMRRRGHAPAAENLTRIAEILGVSLDWLAGRSDLPDPVRSEVTLSDKRIDWHAPRPEEPGIPLVGTGDCADLEVESDSGELVTIDRASFDPDYHVTYIHRPAALRGDRHAYAIYFHGDSMEPRFFAGEVGIAQPTRPPRPGDYVVVQLTNGESEDVASVLVKRLVRVAGDMVELEQHNPAMVFRLPRSKVKRMHRIMPPTDLLL